MAKKSVKHDEIIEALCDDRVTNKFLDKLISDFNSKLEVKFKELTLELNNNLKSSIIQLTTDIVTKQMEPINHDLVKLNERVENLEKQNLMNELIICGLKINTSKTPSDSETKEPQQPTNNDICETVVSHIRDDLGLQLEGKDINFAYLINKNKVSSAPTSILVSFASIHKKNEVIQQAKSLRKDSNQYPRIFYNERLTKRTSELAFKARTLQRLNKISSTWTYRGEVFLRKEKFSKPTRISNINDLEKYN